MSSISEADGRHDTCSSLIFVELIAVMFVLLILALATLPMWPYSTKWTYYPAGGCGFVVTVIVLLALGGRL